MNQRNTAASARSRLLTRVPKARGDFKLILARYVLEGLPYRISISPRADQFPLKAALRSVT